MDGEKQSTLKGPVLMVPDVCFINTLFSPEKMRIHYEKHNSLGTPFTTREGLLPEGNVNCNHSCFLYFCGIYGSDKISKLRVAETHTQRNLPLSLSVIHLIQPSLCVFFLSISFFVSDQFV